MAIGDAARGLGEHALGRGEQLDALHDLALGAPLDRARRSARLTCIANIPSAGFPIASDRAIVSGFTGCHRLGAVLERLGDRAAALRLARR